MKRTRVNRNDWWKAIRTSNLTPQARLLALAMSTFMNTDGTRCYPGQAALANACGWSGSRTVRRALTELERTGYIEIERFAGSRQEGRTQRTHRYWPTIPEPRPTGHQRPPEQPDQPDTHDRLDPVDNPRPTGHTRPVSDDDQPDIEPRPTGHQRPTNRTPVSDNQASTDQAITHHAPARDDDIPPPPPGWTGHNGGRTKDQQPHDLWNRVVEHIATRNGHVRRALDTDRPADRGKLQAALDLAHQENIPVRTLRGLANEPPLDDPTIKSVSSTLAYRIRKHVEETSR